VDFPEFNSKSNEDADFDNKISFIVENVQQDDQWLKDIEENWTHWQTLERLAVSPELNICLSHANNGKVIWSLRLLQHHQLYNHNLRLMTADKTQHVYMRIITVVEC